MRNSRKEGGALVSEVEKRSVRNQEKVSDGPARYPLLSVSFLYGRFAFWRSLRHDRIYYHGLFQDQSQKTAHGKKSGGHRHHLLCADVSCLSGHGQYSFMHHTEPDGSFYPRIFAILPVQSAGIFCRSHVLRIPAASAAGRRGNLRSDGGDGLQPYRFDGCL